MSKLTPEMIKELDARMNKGLRSTTRAEVFVPNKDNKGIYYYNSNGEVLAYEQWSKLPMEVLQSEGEFLYDLWYYLRA